jgi:16S rRNA (adenine(1408)-N(1))-methyltransferase
MARRVLATETNETSGGRDEIQAWAGRFSERHVDLGTGDGKFALHLARKRPEVGVIALDACLDHLCAPRKRWPDNVRFVAEDALAWPAEHVPPATTVSINFPYGSLLWGLVEGDEALLSRLERLLAPGGRLEVRVNASALESTGFDPETGREGLVRSVRRIPGMRVSSSRLAQDDLRRFPSSWAKRLGYGKPPEAFEVRGLRVG